MAQMMNNPQTAPLIDQLLSNPQMLRSMMNPQAMQQAMNMSGAFGMQNQTPQQTAQPQANPFAGLFGAPGMQQPMAQPTVPPTQPTQPYVQPTTQQPSTTQRTPQQIYESQNRQLKEMGFYDENENINVLTRTGGNVNAAVEILLQGPYK